MQEAIAVEAIAVQNIRNDISLLASAGGIRTVTAKEAEAGLHDNGVDSKEVDAGSQGDLEEQQVGIFYGWSPWGSHPNTMLVREQALDLQKQITQVCWERMHEVEWVPPVKYSNFRLAFRIKRGYDRSARSERGHGFELVRWIREVGQTLATSGSTWPCDQSQASPFGRTKGVQQAVLRMSKSGAGSHKEIRT